jgi:transcriptional regulator NrdR family protein
MVIALFSFQDFCVAFTPVRKKFTVLRRWVHSKNIADAIMQELSSLEEIIETARFAPEVMGPFRHVTSYISLVYVVRAQATGLRVL